jgi:uncharacterized protein YlxW (UPF0749 family)
MSNLKQLKERLEKLQQDLATFKASRDMYAKQLKDLGLTGKKATQAKIEQESKAIEQMGIALKKKLQSIQE